ncbi:MAG: histone deacetylase family protein [Microthrixaceae bacterium]|nr:histone deacetylase family protein [Microthrixaceae bacterium]
MRTYWCSDHVVHDPGRLSQPAGGTANYYSEVAQRGVAILDAIAEAGLGDAVDVADPACDVPAVVAQVHDPAMVDFLRVAFGRVAEEEAWGAGDTPLEDHVVIAETFARADDPITSRSRSARAELGRWCADTSAPLFAETWKAVAGAARSAARAADDVAGGARAAYALCRPPGHHAGRSRIGGFCYLNNAAIAASQLGATGLRVAILDVDLHHGNGTQDIFWDRPDVLYASLHIDPHVDYPYYAGFADERGGPGAEGANLNLPLPSGTGEADYLDALDDALAAIAAFDPDALVLSLGADTHRLDPIGEFLLDTSSFARIGDRVASLDRSTVVVQEGGYHLPTLGQSVVGVLGAFES